MKNKIIIIMIFAVPLALFAFLQYFTKDYAANASLNETQTLNKGKLIKFSSPMCSECKKVKGIVDNVIPDYKETVLLEEINVSENTSKSQDMIDTYKISVVPTVIFVNKEGRIINKIEGLVDEITIKENLEKIK